MREGWKWRILAEFTSVYNGNSIPVKEKKENYIGLDSGTPYIGTKDVGFDHQIDYENGVLIPETKSSEFKAAPSGCVLVCAEGGSAGRKVAHNDIKVHFGNKLLAIVPDANTDSRYLFYYFISRDFFEAFSALKTGLIGGVSLKKFRTLRVPLPLLPEQKWIVGILDKAFAAISTAKANAEKNLQNARELFESYLQGVFANPGDGWVEKALSELCDIKHGFAFKSEFFTSKGDYVLLTPGNFYESGGYRDRSEKQKYYTGEIPHDYVLSKGDLLVAMTEQAAGLLGSPILIPESDKFLHNQRLGLITKKPGVPWVNEFFFHVFNTQTVRKEIHDSASGVKVRHTSPTKIGDVVVSFPISLSEQRAIVAKLHALSVETKKIEAIYQQKIADLNELKKSVLQKAFNGELAGACS